jgi:hypothetical protein
VRAPPGAGPCLLPFLERRSCNTGKFGVKYTNSTVTNPNSADAPLPTFPIFDSEASSASHPLRHFPPSVSAATAAAGRSKAGAAAAAAAREGGGEDDDQQQEEEEEEDDGFDDMDGDEVAMMHMFMAQDDDDDDDEEGDGAASTAVAQTTRPAAPIVTAQASKALAAATETKALVDAEQKKMLNKLKRKNRQDKNDIILRTTKTKRRGTVPLLDMLEKRPAAYDPLKKQNFIDVMLCPISHYRPPITERELQERLNQNTDDNKEHVAHVLKHGHPRDVILAFLVQANAEPATLNCVFRLLDRMDIVNDEYESLIRADDHDETLAAHSRSWKPPDLPPKTNTTTTNQDTRRHARARRLIKETRRRVDCLTELADAAAHKQQWHVLSCVHIYLHMHAALMIQLEDGRESRFDAFAPSQCDTRVLTESSMPNLVPLLKFAFRYNNGEISNARMIKQAFPFCEKPDLEVLERMTHLLYKSIPEKCFGRQLNNLLKTCCNKSPYLVDLVGRVILASLLGVYETAHVKPRAATIVHLYRVFYRGITVVELAEIFALENAFVMLFIFREFFHFTVHLSPAATSCITEMHDWEQLCVKGAQVCDEMRAHVDTIFADNVRGEGVTLAGIIGELQRACVGLKLKSATMCQLFNKPSTLGNDVTAISRVLMDFNLVTYRARHADDARIVGITQHTCMQWSGREYLLPDPVPRIEDPVVRGLMKQIIDLCPDDRHLPTHWLVLFGMSQEAADALRVRAYGSADKFTQLLHTLTPHEHALVQTFYELASARTLYAERPSFLHVYLKKMTSMVAFFRLRPEDKFPIVAAATLGCPNCLEVKSQVFHTKHIHGHAGATAGKVVLTREGERMCARRPTRTSWQAIFEARHARQPRGLKERRAPVTTERSRFRKIAKIIAKQHMLRRCGQTEMLPLSAVNGSFVFARTESDACTSCGFVLAAENMAVIGIFPICKPCIAWHDFNAVDRRETCEYCSDITFRDNRTEALVYDDCAQAAADRVFRRMYFCGKHHPLYWIARYGYHRKSDIMTGIINDWGKMTARGVIIEVGTITVGRYIPPHMASVAKSALVTRVP